MELTSEQLISSYLQCRDKLEKMETEFAAQKKPITEAMQGVEAELHKRMLKDKTQSIRAGGGTAFFKERTSITVKDWNETLPFIIKHNLWHMLDAGVNKKAAMKYMNENNGTLVPGTNYSSRLVIQIRRGKD